MLLVVGAVGFALGWLGNGWIGGNGRDLTGSEAAELARRTIFEQTEDAPSGLTCDAQDFNEGDGAWIILCTNPNGGNLTLRVFDDTSRVEVVR
jgi:hypothetical protein